MKRNASAERNDEPGVIHESVEYRQSRSRKLRGNTLVRLLRGGGGGGDGSVATACTLLKLKSILAAGEIERKSERATEWVQ